MTVTAQAIPILSDNYAWLLRDDQSGFTAIVDPAEEGPIVAAIEAAGGRLDAILLTHHHDDHIAAVEPIRARYGARVIGATADAHRLPKLDESVREGDTVKLGSASAQVIDTPGHTVGHIAYFIQPGAVLLSGDTLFSLGCGKLLEGTAADMFASLQKLAVLPPESVVCCGHEYTQSNARFALTVEPDNAALRKRAAEVDQLRAEGKPTVPTRLGDEKAQNPFLRAPDAASLANIRTAKDNFR
jgi:hydroxyacylglutathione hydrolase